MKDKDVMAGDGQAIQGAKASAVIILNKFSQNIPVSAPKVKGKYANYYYKIDWKQELMW